MTYDEINALPEKTVEKIMTVDEASKLLLREVYFHFYRFGLRFTDEDDRSDFILNITPKLSRLFHEYKPDIGPFAVFFISYITGALYSWRRQVNRKYYVLKVMEGAYKQLHEENQELYTKNEFSENPETEQQFPAAEQACPVYTDSNPDDFNWCSRNVKQKVMLILALKSSYYITGCQIQKISELCGCSTTLLENKIILLRQMLDNKARRHENFKQSRDNAYYFHRKYMIEINCIQKNSTRYQSLVRKYVKYTNRWKYKNNLLCTNHHRVCPTNKSIGKMLGICDRQVSYYITLGEKYRKQEEGNPEVM